ncbi:MAG: response regulator [Deltaproteobacteria bacterium]|nr:response regulator [Deltaproteobacteria bacterium]
MSSPELTVLVIEDEAPIRAFLRAFLQSQNYKLIEATTGGEGISLAASHNPDVILLDLGLPDIDGLEVIKRVREWTNTPIIIISARGKEQDKIDGLDAGADDYLIKPFSVGELAARMRVALRHALNVGSKKDESAFQTGEVRVDLAGRQVWVAEEEVHLTPIEFKLLLVMIKHAGKVVTHRQLLKEVWGQAGSDQSHYLRIYVHQLRHKLEPDPARPTYLRTEPGVGYRLICID